MMEYKRMVGPMTLGTQSGTMTTRKMTVQQLTERGGPYSQEELRILYDWEHKRMAGSMMLGDTDTVRAGGVVQELAAQWRARDVGKPVKGAPAPSARPVSVFEVKRQHAEYIETIAHNLSQELGLMSTPPVRWFYGIAEEARHEPGWKALMLPLAPGNTPRGFFDPTTREVWLKSDLPYEDELLVLRHELRHAWQHDTYGPSYYALGPAVAEADATAYGEKYR